MMIEDFTKERNNSLIEIQEKTCKQVENLKEETQKSLTQTRGEGIEQNHSGSKNRNRINEEITKGDNTGDIKPRKENSSHSCKHHQQNTRDKRENLRYRRYHRKH